MRPQGHTLKLILAGNAETGKTLFMHRWIDPNAQLPLQPTVATEFMVKTWEENGVIYRVQLWDTAGQESYHSITAPYFRSAKGVFLVFDLTSRKSFDSLPYWLQLIEENSNAMPLIVIIGNKTDLPNPEVDFEMIAKFCGTRGLTFFMVSALTGENVENAAVHMLLGLTKTKVREVQEEKIALDGDSRAGQGCC
jgi:small GTP-binding protein